MTAEPSIEYATDLEVPVAELRRALDAQLQRSLPPLMRWLTAIYGFLLVANPLSSGVLSGHWPALDRMFWLWQLTVFVACGAFAWWQRERRVSAPWAHPVTFACGLLPLVDSLLHIGLVGDPYETLSYVLVLFGMALVVTSEGWYAAFLIVALAAWGVAAAHAYTPALVSNLIFVMVEGSLLACAVMVIRLRTLRRLERVRWLAERRGAQLDAQNQQLLAVDRLKSEFVNAVSHDLRTPLTSIKGYAEFLEDGIGGTLSPEQLAYVAQIGSGTRRLERLVDDLLDFARIEAGAFRLRRVPSRLGGLAADLAQSLAIVYRDAGVTLELMPPEADPLMAFDPQRIGQVLSNLLANAAKFTPAGGVVRVRLAAEGAQVRLEVTDTGVGIAPEDVPRLFQRFSQLHAGREKGGTGLGLAISKSIVEAHGGAIGAESRLGEGSTFWFTLPLSAALDAPLEPTAPAERLLG